MTDDLVKRLQSKYASPQDAAEAADRIEKLQARIVLLEGHLRCALDVVEAFTFAEVSDVRAALEGEQDEQ